MKKVTPSRRSSIETVFELFLSIKAVEVINDEYGNDLKHIKSPRTKSPHYIPPNCSTAQYILLYINVIFKGQFSSTFVRCDIFHGHEVEKRS